MISEVSFELLPAWIGWVALAAALLAGAWLFYRQRKNKAWEREHETGYSIIIDGFPYTTLPIDVPREQGLEYVHSLRRVYRAVRERLEAIYNARVEYLPFTALHLIHGEVDPDHPGIKLHLQSGICTADMDHDLLLNFAGECHNAFRYKAFGLPRVFKPLESEMKQYRKAVAFINAKYGEE